MKYNSDGTAATTAVSGSSSVGLYAADGSVNVVLDDASHTGPYHPSGALRVNSTFGSSVFDASGAYYINTIFGGAGGSSTVPPTRVSVATGADAWCWFHEPRALTARGKLWFGTTGANDNSYATGRATLYEIDEATGVVSKTILGSSAIAATWADDHDYPSVVLRPDGRLIAFYCPHRTGGPIYFRISVSPYTLVDGWSQEYSLGNGGINPTYPSPVILTGESNRLYLFYRNGTSSGPLAYITSDDIATVAPAVSGGALGATPTWTSELQLGSSTGTQGIYHKVVSNANRIDLLMTDAVGAQAGTKTDTRHGYWQAGLWHKSDGTSLGDGSTPPGFTAFTAVATSGAPDSFGDMWCHHLQRRSNGIIEAVFWRFVSASDHRCYYARWNGSAWSKVEVDAGYGMGVPDTRSTQITDGQGAVEGYYSPGAFFDTVDEGVLYISVGTAAYSQLYRYKTADGGTTWTRQRVSSLAGENVRPVVPVNRTTKFSVLWLSGAYHYYDFNSNPAASDIGYTTVVNIAARNYSVAGASPVNTVLPSVGGSTGTEGNVLSASVGTWTGDTPLVYTYKWTKGGVDIVGATSSTYTILAGDVASSITVTVTATNYFGTTAATSAPASALPTNLLTHSETFNLWTASSLSVTTNVANDPVNGSAVAERIAEQAALAQHSITSATFSATSGTAYTFSVYAKYETAQYIQLLLGSAAFGSNAWANFDIQNGTVGTKGSSATCSVVNAGGGWFRLIMTATATGTASGPVAIYAANASTMTRASSFTGVVSNTRLLADAQVESGSSANTYVTTA